MSQQIILGPSDQADPELYPLGGAWRVGFSSPFYHKVHMQMAREELRFTSLKDKEKKEGKYFTNVALCQLMVYVDNGDGTVIPHEISGLTNKLFLSGGHVLLEGRTDFVHIIDERGSVGDAVKKTKSSISSLLNSLSKLSNDLDLPTATQTETETKTASATASVTATTVDDFTHPILVALGNLQGKCAELLKEYEALKVKSLEIQKLESEYVQENAFQDMNYECKTHRYDAEQVILRQIDRHLKGITQTGTLIALNENLTVATESIRRVILHIHSRFDMCQYCLSSVHRRIPDWKKAFGNLTFNIIVSSRQEYIPNALVLFRLPTYEGSSMRYVGVDNRSKCALSDEDVENFSQKELVAQVCFPAWEILGF